MDRDTYRSMSTDGLLAAARNGVTPEMAIVLAERLEMTHNRVWNYKMDHPSMGGRYTFNSRSE